MEASILKLLQGQDTPATKKKQYRHYTEFSAKPFPLSKTEIAVKPKKMQKVLSNETLLQLCSLKAENADQLE